MADITAVVSSGSEISATIQQTNLTLSSTNLANPATVDTLASIADVDTSTNGLTTGSILIYRTTTNRWTSSTTLDAQNMEGGEF
jgi:hypothetical protein